MAIISHMKKLLCSILILSSPICSAETNAFRIECTANFLGKETKVAFEYNLKYPKTFGVGYGPRSKSESLVAYDLVEIEKKKIEGTDIEYLAIYYNDNPYNEVDYPNQKTITQNKLSFFHDSTLSLHSAKLNINKSKLEWAENNSDASDRNCISIGVG